MVIPRRAAVTRLRVGKAVIPRRVAATLLRVAILKAAHHKAASDHKADHHKLAFLHKADIPRKAGKAGILPKAAVSLLKAGKVATLLRGVGNLWVLLRTRAGGRSMNTGSTSNYASTARLLQDAASTINSSWRATAIRTPSGRSSTSMMML